MADIFRDKSSLYPRPRAGQKAPYSVWDWIMARVGVQDVGRLAPPPPGVARADPPIFAEAFYAALTARVPLQSGALSPFLGEPVVPVLDLLGLTVSGVPAGAYERAFAEKMFVGHIVGSDFPPLAAGAAAGTVGTVSIFNPLASGKRIFPLFLSQVSAAGLWGWRRHNVALATSLRESSLNSPHPKRCTDGSTRTKALFTSADILAASFPPTGASEVVLIGAKGASVFNPASPTIQPLAWLDPGKGLIVYASDVFGAGLLADQRPAGHFTIVEEAV